MALIGASVPMGATWAPTGGTARTLTSLGGNSNPLRLLVNDSANYQVRNTIEASVRDAVAQAGAPGGYTAIKRQFKIHRPKVLADGSVFVQGVTITLDTHPEISDAENTSLLSQGSALLNDAETSPFMLTGSLT